MAMHDIWNPWHGCVRWSEGCDNCYMFTMDKARGRDGSVIYRTKSGFDYPLQCDRTGQYKVKSGETIRVCMNSDFFIEEADEWRDDAWEIMRRRPDVLFWLLTKRPHRIRECLPDDWGDGWENVALNVTAENQRRADERIPILLDIPAKHKGVMCAPFIGEVSIARYLESGQLEKVVCGGENYDGARPCCYDWVKLLYDECKAADVTFCFIETGNLFIKDRRLYRLKSKRTQSEMAHKSGMNHAGRPIHYRLCDNFGMELPQSARHVPTFREHCKTCGSRPICAGCGNCRKCAVLGQ